MAITYPIDLPASPGIRRVVFRPQVVTPIGGSPFTYQQQTVLQSGDCWGVEATLPPMVRADAENWIACLLKLRGQFGTFFIGDPAGKTPRGNPIAPMKATGTAGSLTITCNFPVNASLLAGDYISVGTGVQRRLYKLLGDAVNGTAVNVFPRVRESFSDVTLTCTNATGTFRLAKNTVEWDINEIMIFGLGFTAIEAI